MPEPAAIEADLEGPVSPPRDNGEIVFAAAVGAPGVRDHDRALPLRRLRVGDLPAGPDRPDRRGRRPALLAQLVSGARGRARAGPRSSRATRSTSASASSRRAPTATITRTELGVAGVLHRVGMAVHSSPLAILATVDLGGPQRVASGLERRRSTRLPGPSWRASRPHLTGRRPRRFASPSRTRRGSRTRRP